MSLLDDVSIVVTPNGYKAGTLYGVIPSSGAADMDVTRATAGTRVDENGLVNYAQVVTGSDIVTNGDFSNGSTDWTLQNGWSLGTNDVEFNTSLSQYRKLFQENFLNIGSHYKLTFEIKSISSGSIANFGYSGSFDTIGVNTQIFTAIYDDLYLEPTNDAVLTIDNIKVEEVTRNNVPRIDYTGGGCPHILAEPQRTNLVTYSEDFSNWNNFRSTLTPNETTSPDGTINAYLVEQDYPNTSIHGGLNKSIAVTNGVEYTYSFFVKKKEYSFIELAEAATSSGNVSTWFDVENGVVGNIGAGSTAQIEDYGSGWYRCSITFTSAFTGGRNFVLYLSAANGSSTANIVGGAYIWGAQLEAGSYPTSYIKTSGSTVTRNADQFTRDGIASLINSTEGVLFFEGGILSDDGTTQIISLFESTSSRVSLTFSTTLNRIQFYVAINGFTNTVTINAEGFTKTDINKIALRYGANNYALFINGVKEGENTTQGNTFTVGSLTELTLSNTLPFYGKVKQLQVYDTALTDMQLIQLTGTSGTDFYESYSEMAESLTYTIQ